MSIQNFSKEIDVYRSVLNKLVLGFKQRKLEKPLKLVEKQLVCVNQFFESVNELDGFVNFDEHLGDFNFNPEDDLKNDTNYSEHQLYNLCEKDKLIQYTQRCGFRFKQARRFSKKQIEISHFITANYNHLLQLLFAIQHNSYRGKLLRIDVSRKRGQNKLKGQIADKISQFGLVTKSFDGKQFRKELNSKKFFFNNEWFVEYNPDAATKAIVLGEWLECFANITFSEYMKLNRIESFTWAKSHLVMPLGEELLFNSLNGLEKITEFEIDMFAFVNLPNRPTLIYIECKSGTFENIQSNFDKTVVIVNNLKQKFSLLKFKLRLDAYLLVPPQYSDKRKKDLKNLQKQFSKADITICEITDFRTVIINKYAY